MQAFDVKNFGRVAVLHGGLSAEREVSLSAGQLVVDSLKRSGVDAFAIDITENVIEQIQASDADRAFVVLYGGMGEDGRVQAILDALKIPYTGSDVAACSLSMHKLNCKFLWKGADLPTPEFQQVTLDSDLDRVCAELGLPLAVKPVNGGSSFGVTKVTHISQFRDAVAVASQYDSLIIAERWIEGSEVTVAIIGNQTLPSIKINTPREFYDYAAKYEEATTEYICPSGLAPEKEKELQQLALRAYQILGCSGWGRVDCLLDANDNIYLMEINLVPGMSLVPKAAKVAGIEFDELMLRILATTDEK